MHTHIGTYFKRILPRRSLAISVAALFLLMNGAYAADSEYGAEWDKTLVLAKQEGSVVVALGKALNVINEAQGKK